MQRASNRRPTELGNASPASQERDLVIAAECGDSDACRKLVEAFLPAIASLARGFQSSRVERRELLQEGVAGLLFAARRYDPGVGTPFWAYAVVLGAQGDAGARRRADASCSPVGSRRARARTDQGRAARAHAEAWRRADRRGAQPRDRLDAGAARGAAGDGAQAAEHPARPRAQSDESSPTVGDTIVDPTAEQAYQQVLDDLEIHDVRDLMDQLDERERSIVRAHYGLGTTTQTLRQIGASLGLTAERARQIEVAALAKLRAALARPAPSEAPGLESARKRLIPECGHAGRRRGPRSNGLHTGTALRHNALVYESQDEYLARAVPFLEEGIAAGEGAIVAHTKPGLAMMREALGDDAGPSRSST